jgi:hypothetical protein
MSWRGRLEEACADLRNPSGDARERLLKAAREFEAAAAEQYARWPQGLQAQADAIRAVLFRHGVPEQSIGQLGDREVSGLLRSLRRFCDEALREAG